MANIFQHTKLKLIQYDLKTRLSNKTTPQPSFKYVIEKAPGAVLSHRIMMNLKWDPKISFPYGIDPSLVDDEQVDDNDEI